LHIWVYPKYKVLEKLFAVFLNAIRARDATQPSLATLNCKVREFSFRAKFSDVQRNISKGR